MFVSVAQSVIVCSVSLFVITVVKDDLEGLMRTSNSVSLQNTKVTWVVISPKDNSPTYEAIIELKWLGIVDLYVEDTGSGIYSAMNLGIQLFDSESWIWYLNAGDEFADPKSVEMVVAHIVKTNHRWLYGGVFLCTERGKVFAELEAPRNLKIENQLFSNNFVCHQSTIFKVGFLQTLGGFNLNYKVASDWDLIVRALKIDPGERIPAIISKFYLGGYSTSARQKSNKELFALRNLHLGFRYFLPSILWFGYRYFRNYIVLFLEKHLVELVNFLRVAKHRSKNRYNHD